jgi:hypothetical protein
VAARRRLVALFLTDGKRDNLQLPEGMDPMKLVFRWFAVTYGWTPSQVVDLDLEDLTWFPLIEQADHRAQEIKRRQEERRRST